MHLKRLELLGFKSFADRTGLDFDTSLTGVVGPNGCGKSNVVDAVRWALGEQRPTSMRGDEMADVIFKGSASRPAMSVAEVTLVLDNGNGAIADHGAEISVTRRVYKSGEGEYLIDGDRVRLKDVREMLFDTGLGSRGYSVLEQGRIDAVLSANPLERRSIFEEAAGISRYRQRRREAESRLARVQSDVVRLDDVVSELERRSRSLKIQAGRARRYVEARDAWKVEGERLARHQVHGLNASLANLGMRIEEMESRAERGRSAREAAEGDVASREREQEALSGEVERLSNETSEVAGEVRASDERRMQLQARVRGWEASAEDEAQRAVQLERKLGERTSEGGELREGLATLGAEGEAAAERLAREEEHTKELSREYTRARAAAERQNEVVLELLHERTSLQNAAQHLERSLTPLGERARRGDERRADSERHLEEARAAETRAAAEIERAGAALRAALERRSVFEREAGELDGTVERLRTERSELEVERARLKARVESLLDRQHERELLESGAREVLAGVEDGSGPELAGELAGLFADHLRTRTHAARALDAVLGDRAQALVVREGADARSVVRWLKERKAGQVRLVAPGGFGPVAGSPPLPGRLFERDGVEGRLRELVETADGFADLGDLLLGDVVLVRDVEVALALVRDYPAVRFVTPEGDLVEAGGIVGGHREVAQGPIGRRSHAAELEAEAGRIDADLARREGELAGVGEEREKRRAEIAALDEELEHERRAETEASAGLEAAHARVADLDEARRLVEHECEGIAAEHAGLLGELEETRAKLVDAERRFAEENESLRAAEECRRELEGERERQTHAESHARLESMRLLEKREADGRRLADLEAACAELTAELERARRLTRECRESAAAGAGEAEDLATSRVGLLERRGELEALLTRMRERERAGRAAIDELRRQSEGATRELEELMGEVSELRLERQRQELARDEILRRAQEDFGRMPYELLDGFQPEDELADESALDALSASVGELKAQMDKLGPVNLDAVEELEGVSERLGFLTGQRTDLQDARRTLERTLATINAESERLFLEAFEEIRGHFHSIFRQLFGGGRADIELAEGTAVLEAGIEIVARPPGRESLPISLLSGGQRALTALALLFAVFRSRPSPFCVLDEVDAALDDANIGRFLSLLDTFRVDTQFIIVTHNKGTMSACELLYGITMAVRGVSHVVSVELSDVDEFVPEASGTADPSRATAETAAEATPPAQAPSPAEAPPPAEPEPAEGTVKLPARPDSRKVGTASS